MLKTVRLQINQLESVLQTDEAKEVLSAALLTTASAGEDSSPLISSQEDESDVMIDGVLALNTTDASFQSDIVRDEIEEDVSAGDEGSSVSQEPEPGTTHTTYEPTLQKNRLRCTAIHAHWFRAFVRHNLTRCAGNLKNETEPPGNLIHMQVAKGKFELLTGE